MVKRVRDPSNTRRDLRHVRGDGEFSWVVSHSFRKTMDKPWAATTRKKRTSQLAGKMWVARDSNPEPTD